MGPSPLTSARNTGDAPVFVGKDIADEFRVEEFPPHSSLEILSSSVTNADYPLVTHDVINDVKGVSDSIETVRDIQIQFVMEKTQGN